MPNSIESTGENNPSQLVPNQILEYLASNYGLEQLGLNENSTAGQILSVLEGKLIEEYKGQNIDQKKAIEQLIVQNNALQSQNECLFKHIKDETYNRWFCGLVGAFVAVAGLGIVESIKSSYRPSDLNPKSQTNGAMVSSNTVIPSGNIDLERLKRQI